jgi:cobalamin 5'-phosphate synthase/cobalamin synthase
MIVDKPFIAPFFTALAFLTRVPVPNATCTPEAIGRAAGAFPVIGALAGLLSVAIFELTRAMPSNIPPTLIAVVIVLGGILLTGALHLDGLADTADGFGGGWTRDDVLRIMRDHQIGTFGALALIVTLLLQVVSIATLIERDAAAAIRALIVAPTVGRWGIVVLGRWLPYARSDAGLGRSVTDHVRQRELLVATALTLAIVLLASLLTSSLGVGVGVGLGLGLGLGPASLAGAASLATTLIATGLFGSMCRRRIGGITGDTLGADAVLCETLALIVAVACS